MTQRLWLTLKMVILFSIGLSAGDFQESVRTNRDAYDDGNYYLEQEISTNHYGIELICFPMESAEALSDILDIYDEYFVTNGTNVARIAHERDIGGVRAILWETRYNQSQTEIKKLKVKKATSDIVAILAAAAFLANLIFGK